MEGDSKGRVCVTGGTGFVASWLIFKLLQHGYSVNTTIRSSPVQNPLLDSKRDVCYLTDLPGALERLRIFEADLEKPVSFGAAIEGCIGVFHLAHPIDYEGKESEEEKIKKSVNGTLGILQACIDAKTVKRVVYTSSAAAVVLNDKGLDVLDESTWSDIDYIRRWDKLGGVHAITKVLAEQACLEFAEKHGLDLVTIIPTWIHGPFLVPHVPGSVRLAMAMIFGEKEPWDDMSIPLVHTDDVARAHIHLFEYPEAEGRYNCCALEIAVPKLVEFLAARYPEYQLPSPESLQKIRRVKYPALSSQKLLDTGFKYKYGLEEMFDGAVQCCKQKGLL